MNRTVQNTHLRTLRITKSIIRSLKSSDVKMSFSMLISDNMERRSCPMMLRSSFFMRFSVENDRSPLQLEIQRYMRNAMSTFGKV